MCEESRDALFMAGNAVVNAELFGTRESRVFAERMIARAFPVMTPGHLKILRRLDARLLAC